MKQAYWKMKTVCLMVEMQETYGGEAGGVPGLLVSSNR